MRDGSKVSERPQISLFLARFSSFLNTWFSGAARLWLISEVLKKLILAIFVEFLIASMEKRISGNLYSNTYADDTHRFFFFLINR